MKPGAKELSDLPTGTLAEIASILEATARKAGNVHPLAAFADTTWLDFLLAAAAAAPALDRAPERSLGETVLDAVERSLLACGRNVNLGIVLLQAPLAKVARGENLEQGVAAVLRALGPRDAALVYEAIRKAAPGGLGRVEEADVRGPPPEDLVHAMELAAERDLVARQYATDFADVFHTALPLLERLLASGHPLETAIVSLHLELIARLGDTLILRKAGKRAAEEAARRARDVLDRGWPDRPEGREAFAAYDAWLRADGNRRNPGATADLTAAALFCALRTGIITRSRLSGWTSPEELQSRPPGA